MLYLFQIRENEAPVEWEYFKILHNMDKLQSTCKRSCPKVSDAHVDIANNSLTKMSFFFAVQVCFSALYASPYFTYTYKSHVKYFICIFILHRF